jgi:sigma-B regulation protein RsbU (phosphoserine phosphatase)
LPFGRRVTAVAAITLPSEPASVPAARQFVREFLADEGVDAVLALPAVLLTSELVTNGVIHAHTDLDVRAKLANDSLRLEVVDHGGGLPLRGQAARDAERGRGLTVVSELATRWGVVMEPDWKSVWFELRCPRSPSRRERRLLLDKVASQTRRFIRRLPRP